MRSQSQKTPTTPCLRANPRDSRDLGASSGLSGLSKLLGLTTVVDMTVKSNLAATILAKITQFVPNTTFTSDEDVTFGISMTKPN